MCSFWPQLACPDVGDTGDPFITPLRVVDLRKPELVTSPFDPSLLRPASRDVRPYRGRRVYAMPRKHIKAPET